MPAKPGFARRKPRYGPLESAKKEGAHGGTLGSPMFLSLVEEAAVLEQPGTLFG